MVSTKFGLGFDFRADSDQVLDLLSGNNRSILSSALAREPSAVQDLFLEELPGKDDGLLDTLIGELSAARQALEDRLGSRGNLVSVIA